MNNLERKQIEDPNSPEGERQIAAQVRARYEHGVRAAGELDELAKEGVVPGVPEEVLADEGRTLGTFWTEGNTVHAPSDRAGLTVAESEQPPRVSIVEMDRVIEENGVAGARVVLDVLNSE